MFVLSQIGTVYFGELATTTTILPIASLRFLSRKMTHLSDWIIPHLGGRVEIHHFVVPIPRNPALLGQETSFTWRPGTGRYTKHSAHSGSYDTLQQSATSSRVRLCEPETLRL